MLLLLLLVFCLVDDEEEEEHIRLSMQVHCPDDVDAIKSGLDGTN